jgi:hypothetical protein
MALRCCAFSDGDIRMTYEKLALLRSLAARPSRNIAPSVQHLVDALSKEGYLTEDKASGWSATAEGCTEIERNRVR